MAIVKPTALVAPDVQPDSAYRVYVDGYLVSGVTYANTAEGVVRYRCGDGSETEVKGEVRIIAV